MVFPVKTLTWTLILAGIFTILSVSIYCYDNYVAKGERKWKKKEKLKK